MTSPTAESYVFIFVRQDIPLEHQTVQATHAALHLHVRYAVAGIPNIVLIGLPDQAALRRAIAKLEASTIGYFLWEEPDYGFGLTAIATEPITAERKQALRNYRLYSPVVSIKTSPSKGDDVGESPAGRATFAAEAQQNERPILIGRTQVQALPAAPRARTEAFVLP